METDLHVLYMSLALLNITTLKCKTPRRIRHVRRTQGQKTIDVNGKELTSSYQFIHQQTDNNSFIHSFKPSIALAAIDSISLHIIQALALMIHSIPLCLAFASHKNHYFRHSIIHSLTHAFITHSLTHSFTHHHTHSLAHSLTITTNQTLTQSLTHSLTH